MPIATAVCQLRPARLLEEGLERFSISEFHTHLAATVDGPKLS